MSLHGDFQNYKYCPNLLLWLMLLQWWGSKPPSRSPTHLEAYLYFYTIQRTKYFIEQIGVYMEIFRIISAALPPYLELMLSSGGTASPPTRLDA